MEEFFDTLPVKRGRPKKIDLLKQRLSLNPQDQEICKKLKQLSSIQSEYLKHEYTPRLQSFIWNSLKSLDLPEGSQGVNLVEIFQENAKFFMITELEFVALSQMIQLVDIDSLSISIEELIKICSFIVKKRMESNPIVLDLLECRVRQQYKKFEENLIVFEKFLEFDIRDLNLKYEDLQKSYLRDVNYTFYVDQILRNSPPYCCKSAVKVKKHAKISQNYCKVEKIETFQDVVVNKQNFDFKKLKPVHSRDGNLKDCTLDDRQKALDFLDDSDFFSGYYRKTDFDNLN
jgi:hypothetical protein